jgi:hypothetical protein
MDPLEIINNVTNDNALKYLQDQQYNNLLSLSQTAIKCNYAMNSEQFKQLERLVHPRPITYSKNLKVISHPVAAYLNHYANDYCINEAKKFSKAIDIGGSPLRTPKNTHMCVLIDDMRTSARYTESAFTQLNIEHDKYDMTSYLSKSHEHCTKGAQNCYYKAQYAYAVNVYDINMIDIASIFENHSLIVLDIWIFLPLSLIKEHYIQDSDIYKVKHLENGKSYFHLNDNSNCYVHETKNWLSYLTTTKIQCNNYSIAVEHKQQLGSFTQIRFTRSQYTNGYIYRCLQIENTIDTILLPDVIYYINIRDATSDYFIKSYNIPIAYFRRLTAWATAVVDTQFNYNSFATYAASIATDIKFTSGNKTIMIHEGFSPRYDDFERIKQSAFIIIAIDRYKRTKNIQKSFKKISKSYSEGIVSKLMEAFKQRVNQIFQDLKYDLLFDDSDNFLKSKYHHIFDLHVIYPSDLFVSGVVESDTFTNDEWRKEYPNRYLLNTNKPYMMSEDQVDLIKKENTPIIKQETHHTFILDDFYHPAVNNNMCHITTFNPKGDGKCGVHALAHLYKDTTLLNKYTGRKYKFGGKEYIIPDAWHADYDLAFIAHCEGKSLTIHQNGTCIGYVGSKDINFAINVCRQHWTVVQCNCNDYHHYIGDYSKLPVIEYHAYVNCANSYLTDGKGQANSFNKLFPGYRKNIKLPIKRYAELNYVQNTFLCLCVAHDNSKKLDVIATHKAYDEIFNSMKHLSADAQNIYMPLLGTGLYKCEMGCFKSALKKSNLRVILCFIDEKQKKDYDMCKECAHAGYEKILDENISYKVINDKIDDEINYVTLPQSTPRLHTGDKYTEIVEYLIEKGIQYKRIHDLSFAPGYFYQRYILSGDQRDYIKAMFKGSYASKPLPNLKPDYCYNNIRKYISDLDMDKDINQQCLFIFDYHVDKIDNSNILNLVCNGNTLITKINAESINIDTFYNTCKNASLNVEAINLNASPLASFELYFIITEMLKDNLENIEMKKSSVVNNMFLHKKNITDSMKCTTACNANFLDKMNCDVTFKSDKRTASLAIKEIEECIKLFDKDFILPNIEFEYDEATISVTNGVAGSRKTAEVLRSTCAACCFVITPYRSNYEDAINNKAYASTFMKCIYNFLKGNIRKTKYVVIDEIFSLPSYYIILIKQLMPDAYIVGIGDMNQIDNRNYAGTAQDYSIKWRGEYITTTHRFPKSVCDILKKAIPGINTTSKVDMNIEIKEELPTDLGDGTLLCFTQAIKDEFKKKFPSSSINTVNAAQSSTIPFVHLYLGDLYNIKMDKARYLYTALSRVTTKLVMYGNSDQINEIYTILDSPIERILTMHNITPIQTVEIESVESNDKKHTTIDYLQNQHATLEGVEQILKKIYINGNENYNNIIGYKSDVLPPMENGKLKFSDAYVQNNDTVINGKRISKMRFMQYHANSNKRQKLETGISRYMKQGKNLPNKLINKYIDGLNKFMKPEWINNMRAEVVRMNKFKYVTNYLKKLQTKYKGTKDYVDLFQDKTYATEGNTIWLDAVTADDELVDVTVFGKNKYIFPGGDPKLLVDIGKLKACTIKLIKYFTEAKMNKIKDLEIEWTDSYHNLVQFHLKTQVKEIRDPNFDQAYKAGQGVSAWSKLLNVLFSAFTRMYSELITKYVSDNVQLSYGKSDCNLQEFFIPYKKYLNDPNYKKMMADFTEFDSSQEEKGILSSAVAFKNLGFDEKIIDFYVKMRKEWTLYNVADSGGMHYSFKLQGEWMQHSGQPMTLDGNTLFNMSAIGLCYNFKDLVMAAFKGDDSFIITKEVEESKIGVHTLVETCQYKIKVFIKAIGEYIANIITPDGNFFPDVLRRTCRAINRIHKDDVDWEETKVAITDALDVIYNPEEFEIGAKVASRFYAQFGINVSVNEIKYLIYYLSYIAKIQKLDDVDSNQYRFLSITN